MASISPLRVADLYKHCDPDEIQQPAASSPETGNIVIGQDRAVKAVNFAVDMEVDGHNLFVLGPSGTGRRTFVIRTLQEAAAKQPTASDWAYVNNFDDPHCPMALELPAGMARQFATTMEDFIDDVHSSLTAAFDTEEYHTQQMAIETEFQDEQSEPMEAVHELAKSKSIRIMQTPTGMIFAPVRDGQVIGPKEFEELPEEEQQQIERDVEEIGDELKKAMEGTPNRVRKMREKIAELDNQVTRFSVGSLINELQKQYAALPRVVEFLQNVEEDLIKNSAMIRAGSEEQMQLLPGQPTGDIKKRYSINVVVSRTSGSPAPVVAAERYTFANLVGRVEQRAQMGMLITDFTLIRGGALHQANGGYLILDARRLLSEPHAWEGLKQALTSRCIKIESLAEVYSLTTTIALEPEPIPLKVKVALVGDRRLYYLLQSLDPEFNKLFKVAADFDDRMDRTADAQREFAGMISTIAQRSKLYPVSPDAICRVIEEASRAAGDREKLSTEIQRTEDLLREGHYWAKQNNHEQIDAADIDAAVTSHEYRHGRIRERMQEEISRGNILIDTEGAKTGQINGLAVHQIGDCSFGRPSRITARVTLGAGKVIDIEREVELGGSLHSKGVLILSGFIAANYVTDKPLSMSATIAFEQSYNGVDGDSASSTELYALLSAIAKVPLSQSLAVTGSVNQYGEVQAIGGVNEKIEGFFDICRERGLTGEQGVIIPAANTKHLMLRKRVIDAVEAGQFAIYAVNHIDEGLSLLTGLDAGKADENGDFPAGSLNDLIRSALLTMARQREEQSHSKTSGNQQ